MLRSRSNRVLRRMALCLLFAAGGGSDPAAGQDAPAELRRISLAEALGIALDLNPELRIAGAQRDQAAAERLGARGAFLPSVGLNYGFTHASTGRLDLTGQTIAQTSHTLQLAGSYDLFTGWRSSRSSRRRWSSRRSRCLPFSPGS
ncbi:hypothetical protein BH18GEM1_BH18GEM1_10340 [soil metagenome]